MTTYCRMSCNHCNMDAGYYCYNHDSRCYDFAKEGRCRTDAKFMHAACPRICNFCGMFSLSLSSFLTFMQLLVSTARASVLW